jgi:hypothetical protein
MELASCAADPVCQMGVLCTIQSCSQFVMAEAGPEALACVTTCFGGDIQSALGASGGVTCITSKCTICLPSTDGGGGNAMPDGGGD